jgi:hypothetical protein
MNPNCPTWKQEYDDALAAYKDENRKIGELNDQIFAIKDEMAGLSVDIAKAKEKLKKAKKPAKVAAAKAKLKRLKGEMKELKAQIPPLEREREAALARREGHRAEMDAAAAQYNDANCDIHLGSLDSGRADARSNKGGKGKGKKEAPDLVISALEVRPTGSAGRDYIVLPPTGKVPFGIQVTVANQGDAETKRGVKVTGKVKQGGAELGRGLAGVQKLDTKGNSSRSTTIQVPETALTLGYADVEVCADEIDKIDESPGKKKEKKNNCRKVKVAVVPQIWDVAEFRAVCVGCAGGTAKTITTAGDVLSGDPPFVYTFRGVSADGGGNVINFEYVGEGTLREQISGNSFGCNVSGEGSVTNAWSFGEMQGQTRMVLTGNLAGYQAQVTTGSATYTVTRSCPQTPPQKIQQPYAPINTQGVQPMSPGATTLAGRGSFSDAARKIEYSFGFHARVPR